MLHLMEQLLPWLKLHHFVIFESTALDGVVVADFSPADKNNPAVLLRMLAGLSVPGRLRLNHIAGATNSLNITLNSCTGEHASSAVALLLL